MSLLSNTESRLILINTQAFCLLVPNMPCKERTLLNDASIHADTREITGDKASPNAADDSKEGKLIAGISGDLRCHLISAKILRG